MIPVCALNALACIAALSVSIKVGFSPRRLPYTAASEALSQFPVGD